MKETKEISWSGILQSYTAQEWRYWLSFKLYLATNYTSFTEQFL